MVVVDEVSKKSCQTKTSDLHNNAYSSVFELHLSNRINGQLNVSPKEKIITSSSNLIIAWCYFFTNKAHLCSHPDWYFLFISVVTPLRFVLGL